MNTQKQQRNVVPLAWAAGWALVSMGMAISDVYSSPNRGLAAYYLLGFAGWAIGTAATIRYVRQRFRADNNVVALGMAGWVIGALAALVLGFFWGSTWNLGFLGPPAAMATGGAIGGGLTLPLRSLSSPAAMVRAGIRGAIVWGVAFLVFQVLAFYAGYILVILTVNQLFPMVGNVWAKVPGWGLPAGVGGFLAGWVGSRVLLGRKDDLSANLGEEGTLEHERRDGRTRKARKKRDKGAKKSAKGAKDGGEGGCVCKGAGGNWGMLTLRNTPAPLRREVRDEWNKRDNIFCCVGMRRDDGWWV